VRAARNDAAAPLRAAVDRKACIVHFTMIGASPSVVSSDPHQLGVSQDERPIASIFLLSVGHYPP